MFRELAPVALIVLLGIMSIYISFTTLVKYMGYACLCIGAPLAFLYFTLHAAYVVNVNFCIPWRRRMLARRGIDVIPTQEAYSPASERRAIVSRCMAVLRVMCLPGVAFGWLSGLALNVCVEVCIILPLRAVEHLFPNGKKVERWSKVIDRWRRNLLAPLCPMLDDRPHLQQCRVEQSAQAEEEKKGCWRRLLDVLRPGAKHVDVSYECVQQSLTHTMRYLDALTTQVLKLKATSREERQKASNRYKCALQDVASTLGMIAGTGFTLEKILARIDQLMDDNRRLSDANWTSVCPSTSGQREREWDTERNKLKASYTQLQTEAMVQLRDKTDQIAAKEKELADKDAALAASQQASAAKDVELGHRDHRIALLEAHIAANPAPAQPPAALAVYDRVAFQMGTSTQLDDALRDLIARSGNTYSVTPEGYKRLLGAVLASPQRPYLVKELCAFNTLVLYDIEDLVMPAELLIRITDAQVYMHASAVAPSPAPVPVSVPLGGGSPPLSSQPSTTHSPPAASGGLGNFNPTADVMPAVVAGGVTLGWQYNTNTNNSHHNAHNFNTTNSSNGQAAAQAVANTTNQVAAHAPPTAGNVAANSASSVPQLGEWVGLDQTLALGYLRNRGTGFARLKAWGGGEADPVQTNYLASHVKSKDPLSFQVERIVSADEIYLTSYKGKNDIGRWEMPIPFPSSVLVPRSADDAADAERLKAHIINTPAIRVRTLPWGQQ